MTMNKVARFIRFDKCPKAFKSLVAGVGLIVDTGRGRMRNQDVKIAVFEELVFPEGGFHSANFAAHLAFSVLFGAVIVEHAPLKPADEQPLILNNPHIKIDAPAGGCYFLAALCDHRPGMMIPEDIIQRNVQRAHNEVKIIERNIPAGKDTANILKPLFTGKAIQPAFNNVAYRQDFHNRNSFMGFRRACFRIFWRQSCLENDRGHT